MTLAMLGGSAVRTSPFAPWPQYDHSEEEALLGVLHSRSWGGYHESVKELEKSFAAYHEVPHALACSNGTIAIEVALRAMGIGPGDEVIVPPYTFIASASAIMLCHATPVFADIDPDTLNLSVQAAEAAITPRTKAIVVVHFGGRPAEMDSFQALAQLHGLKLLEDSAHAHGAKWKGVPVGGWGDIATFSFQSFKLMTAGEGGMVLSKSEELIDKCWAYCNQGRRRDGGWFDHYTLGTNYRITGFQSAVLCEQLKKVPAQTDLRRNNVARFRKGLKDIPGITLVADDPRIERHPYYLLTLRYNPEGFAGLDRDTVIRALQAEGIPAKPTYPTPLYRNGVFAKQTGSLARSTGWHAAQDYQRLHLPEAERVCKDGIWLNHTVFLGDDRDVNDVLEAFRKVQRLASTVPVLETAGKS